MTAGLTIDQLADLVGMSARNIRAHRTRGLLPPPTRCGRVAYYDAHHVARLILVKTLQAVGFSLRAICQVVRTPEAYAAIAQKGRPPTTGWDLPATVPMIVGAEDLRTLDPDLPDELVSLGLLVRDDEGAYAIAPVLAGVGGRLARAGVPLELLTRLQLDVGRQAARLGADFAAALRGMEPEGRLASESGESPTMQLREVLLVGLQLFAAAFEIAFARAAGLVPDDTAGGNRR